MSAALSLELKLNQIIEKEISGTDKPDTELIEECSDALWRLSDSKKYVISYADYSGCVASLPGYRVRSKNKLGKTVKILLVAAILIATSTVIGSIAAQKKINATIELDKDLSEYTTAEGYTGTPKYTSVDDYELMVFHYQLKGNYNSYSDVIKEKENLRKATENYLKYLYGFLAPIESVHGYELAEEMKDKSGLYTTAIDLMNELEQIEAQFPPDEETKVKEIEQALEQYVNSQWSPETHDYTEKGIRCLEILENYRNGLITIKEAMHETGFFDFLVKYRDVLPEQYGNYLSGFNMKSWFDVAEYR